MYNGHSRESVNPGSVWIPNQVGNYSDVELEGTLPLFPKPPPPFVKEGDRGGGFYHPHRG
jgi:hypothetical protein